MLMKKSTIIILVVVAVLLLIVMRFVGIYNSLVGADEGVDSAWAQVENVYQRRMDLIPNLVATVKGYAGHEKETLQAVVEARAKATQMNITADVINDPQMMQKFQAVQGQLSSALSRLLVTVERYPDLKASKNFLALQTQLEGTENRITVERRRFNQTARDYNTMRRRFPNQFIANMMGLQKKAYFEAEKGASTVPKVSF